MEVGCPLWLLFLDLEKTSNKGIHAYMVMKTQLNVTTG